MMNKKSRYYKAFAAALGVHLIAAFALGAYTLLPPPKKDTIIEVTLAGAPKKKGAPKPAEVPPPPPPPPPQKDDIIDERLEEQPQPQKQPTQPQPPAPVTGPPAPAATEGTSDGADNGTPDGNGGEEGVAVELPYITSKSDPSYPEESRRNRHEGTVLLRVLVGENGKPQDIEIAGSSGYDLLDEAAERAVYRWRFSPAKNKFGDAVKCYVTFPVVFRLR